MHSIENPPKNSVKDVLLLCCGHRERLLKVMTQASLFAVCLSSLICCALITCTLLGLSSVVYLDHD